MILLEAGKSDDKGMHRYFTKKPGMIGPMHSEPKLERLFDWGYRSVPQAGLDGRRMPAPRGKVGGGSRLGQRDGLRAGQSRELRLLGGRGQRRVGCRRRQRGLQALRGLRGRRERLPRRRRPDPDLPQGQAAGGHPPVHPGHRRHPRREDPRRLQRRRAGGHRADAAERRRRRALLLHPRLRAQPRSAHAGVPDRGARRQDRHRERPRDRRRGHRPGQGRGHPSFHQGRQGGHRLRRLRQQPAACSCSPASATPSTSPASASTASRTCRSATTCTTTSSTRCPSTSRASPSAATRGPSSRAWPAT
ncbi:hypothetical protein G5V59_11475 [Nocardioides sp. W3-2-3]|nr:hypothetical protein [Nocardioides convexus]